MKSGANTQNVEKVAKFIWENQQEVDGEEDNYISNIAEATDLSFNAVKRAVNHLVSLGVATTFSVGNRKCVRIIISFDKNRSEAKFLDEV